MRLEEKALAELNAQAEQQALADVKALIAGIVNCQKQIEAMKNVIKENRKKIASINVVDYSSYNKEEE